uniref:nitrite reductase (cytochrome; ammonia-forming) n=1 Tax=Schlesneria paludicola TaxID=360056 RepID=A0A7C4QQK9_9PLAN
MRTGTYIFTVIATAAATAATMWLWQNIQARQCEGMSVAVRVVELTEDTVDPAAWGQNFPRQYDSYRRPVDTERTNFGGNEAFQKLDENPRLKTLFAGYPFSLDYREERGHAFMLVDQDETERVHQIQQPGGCLHCHSSVLPAYRELGRKAGVADAPGLNMPQIMRGFVAACAMPLRELRPMVTHPVACLDCHDPQTLSLRVTRPAFLNGIGAIAQSTVPTPHLPSIERWRKGNRQQPYDPNREASRQELRSFVCGQCHAEYYFHPDGMLLTYPWANGWQAEQILDYYDERQFRDWVHKDSGAAVLKAQHPEFELWSQGTHARSGVSCTDCHMPYGREGAVKLSDHQARSPLLAAARACQTCHRQSESELRTRVDELQQRTRELMNRAEDAVVALIRDIAAVPSTPDNERALANARRLHRRAQFLLDYIAADNSMGFHAPQESARVLGTAIDLARLGQLELRPSPRAATEQPPPAP